MTETGTSSGPDRPNSRRSAGLTHTTLSGFFWTSIGTAAQSLLQLLALVVLARILAPSDFGVVAAAMVVVGFSTVFSQLGVGPAVVQHPKLEERHLRTGFTLSLCFGLVMTGLVWLLSPALADFFRMENLSPVVRVISLTFLFQSFSVVAESLLQRELRFRWMAAVDVVSFAVGFTGVGIALAFLGYGVWSLVGAQLAQVLLKSIVLLVLRPHPKRLMMERGALGDLMYFGGGFTVARVGNYLGVQGDNMVVGRWLGAEALGIYGRAYQLMATPAAAFGQVLDKVLFPAMAMVQDSSQRLIAAYRRGVALIALLVLPVSAALLILAPELIVVILGPKWTEVVVPFQIFAVGMLFRTSYKMSDSISRATGAVYRRAWRQGVYAFLVIGGAWFGKQWGLPGVSLCVLFAIAVNFLLMADLSLRLSGMTWRSFGMAHLSACVLTAILGPAIWALATTLRSWSLPPLTILLVSGVVMLGLALLLLRVAPRLVLGQDGSWMLERLGGYLPERFHLALLVRRAPSP